jgi:hypothetical protein
MIELEYKIAKDVSDNILQTHAALDEALLQLSALTQSMVQASRSAQLPASESQKALEAVSEGITGIMASRRGFVSAHKHMIVIKNLSDQRETGFGCLGSGPVRGEVPLRIAA